MTGIVYPRPAKLDKDGKRRAPVKKGERYQLPNDEWRVATSNSTWTWAFVSGTRAAGTRRAHSKGGYHTKTAAQKALTDIVARYQAGDDRVLVKPQRVPVGDYLAGWLEQRASAPADDENHLKPSTLAGYGDAIRAWIAPRDDGGRWLPLPWLGGVELHQLGHSHLTDLYAALRTYGKRCRRCDRAGRLSYQPEGAVCPGCEGAGGRPLGSRSVQLVHVLLRQALAEAVEAGSLPRSPVDRIPKKQRPRHRPAEAVNRYWEPGDARRFLEATAGERLAPLWALALDTGARRGELAALTWLDVDFEAPVVRIRGNRTLVGGEVVEGTTKSGKSRTVDIDARTVTVLRAWRAAQARERLAAGETWTGGQPGEHLHLWTDEIGEAYRPDILSARFEQAQRGVDVPPLVLHGTRHTSATMALAAGVPVHVVSKRLGHADVKITLSIYAHVLDKQRTDAAQRLGDELYGDTATGTGGGS
jgi:integrase